MSAVPRNETGDGWSRYLEQNMGADSVEDWDSGIVKLYHTGRKQGLDDFQGWSPHVDFVIHVNRSYPYLGARSTSILRGFRTRRCRAATMMACGKRTSGGSSSLDRSLF